MAFDETYSKLEEMFGTTDPPIVIRLDQIKQIELPKEEYAEELAKMNRGEKLTVDEIQKLPEKYQMFYYLQEDAVKEQDNLMRRAKLKLAREKRRARLEHEKNIYERVLRKLKARVSLLPYEVEIYEKYSSKVSDIKEPEIQVDAVDILNDVVKGNYTLQDVEMIRKSSLLEPPKDDFQNSPIRLLDSVVENVKQQTHDAVQTSHSDHFFKNVDANIQSRVTPMNLNEIISSCATGIDLMSGSKFDENDARDACESYVKAMAMYEGEMKIRNAVHDANRKQIEKETERLAEVAAVSGAFSDGSAQKTSSNRENQEMDFNITNTSFDISFVPSDDPDVYKPLEIISYIGMTK